MTPKQRLQQLIATIVPDVVFLMNGMGDPADLTTTATNVVAAINELQAEITGLAAGGGAAINDAATDGDTTATWSANKIFDELVAAKAAMKSETKAEILGGASAAHDTLAELQALLENQDDSLASLLTAVGNRVRFDAAQSLTEPQKAQARGNIGAADAALLAELDYDFAAEYVALRDA